LNTQQFEWVVETYSPMLLRIAFLYLKSTAEAEDIAQEVLLTYWQKEPHFPTESARKSWLYKVTANRCRDQIRSHWFRNREELPPELPYLPPEESALLDAMLKLDAKYRIPIHLHYYEGYSLKEIGKILSLPTSTVGTRLHRGKELLKTMLGGMNDENL